MKLLSCFWLAVMAAAVLVSTAGAGTVLVDDFDDGVVDATKWISLEVGGGTIIEEDGVMKVNTVGGDRAYLATAGAWNPAAGAVTMTGTLTVIGGGSQWSIWPRSSDHYDTTGTMAGTMLSSGVRIAYWDAAQSHGYNNIGALIKEDETWPWSGLGTGVDMPDPYAEEMDFVLTDDGTTITLMLTDTSDSSNTATWSTDTDFDEGNYHIAFSATNMALDNVQIDVVPEPGTLALFAAGLLGLTLLRNRRR